MKEEKKRLFGGCGIAGRSMITLATLVASLQVSEAALSVTVTGDAAGGGTTWVFNGVSVVGDTKTLEELDLLVAINSFTHGVGDLSDNFADEANINSTSYLTGFEIGAGGSVTGSISGAFTFDGLFLDPDPDVGSDDFGWMIGDQVEHDFTEGESITFDNYTLITNLDITLFGDPARGNQIANNGDSFTVTSTSEDIADLSITFTAASVPEPSSLLLCGMGAIGLTLRRRRA